MHNFGSIIADKQDIMDTCVKHRGMCHYAIILENGNVQWIFHLQEVGTDQNSVHNIFWRQQSRQ